MVVSIEAADTEALLAWIVDLNVAHADCIGAEVGEAASAAVPADFH
jgi:hypothetical protein